MIQQADRPLILEAPEVGRETAPNGTRQLLDLIEEYRALSCELQDPRLPRGLAGYRTRWSTEELGLEEAWGQRRTLNRDEGILRTRTFVVDPPCKERPARSGFPMEQDKGSPISYEPSRGGKRIEKDL